MLLISNSYVALETSLLRGPRFEAMGNVWVFLSVVSIQNMEDPPSDRDRY